MTRPAPLVFVLHGGGTDDPVVPDHGGGVSRGRNGRIVDTAKAVKMWRERDGCDREAFSGELPDADPKDNCRVKWFRWSNGQQGTEVVHYAIEGGGHTWPGRRAMPPSIGRVRRDFEAAPAIWEFFKKHLKP